MNLNVLITAEDKKRVAEANNKFFNDEAKRLLIQKSCKNIFFCLQVMVG